MAPIPFPEPEQESSGRVCTPVFTIQGYLDIVDGILLAKFGPMAVTQSGSFRLRSREGR